MKFNHLVFISVIAFISCNTAPQYSVRVINSAGEPIEVFFKSDTHADGPIESSVQLKDGESQIVVSTIDFENKSSATCDAVADYIKATNAQSKESKLKWCSADIRHQMVDIGQYEYVVEYKKEHF